ncbi:MAG: membrane lipoprotein lipid attachment site-containing protein [Oscillospiraceae bacterium]|nr:membrane lipoprotein lipid attachment site-containing protein [Oscillospiraceae bacterium]
MKKLIVFGLVLAVLLAGCSPGNTGADPMVGAEPDDGVITLNDRVFIAQVNDIFTNLEDYLGRTVRYEGRFKTGVMPLTGQDFYYVVRYGPGCCGPEDGMVGFEVAWPNGWPEGQELPQPDDWIEVVGVFELYDEWGFDQLRVTLTSFTILEEEGTLFVNM